MKKQLPHLLCTTNMLLHGIEVPSEEGQFVEPFAHQPSDARQGKVLTRYLADQGADVFVSDMKPETALEGLWA